MNQFINLKNIEVNSVKTFPHSSREVVVDLESVDWEKLIDKILNSIPSGLIEKYIEKNTYSEENNK